MRCAVGVVDCRRLRNRVVDLRLPSLRVVVRIVLVLVDDAVIVVVVADIESSQSINIWILDNEKHSAIRERERRRERDHA